METIEEYHLKANALERQLAFRRGFFGGLAAGIGVVIMTIGLVGFTLYVNRVEVGKWAVNNYVIGYVRDFFAGFPDAYMTHNGDRVYKIMDNFTNAVADGVVDGNHFEEITSLIFRAVEDKKVTYQEMEEILTALDRASDNWSRKDRDF